MKSKLNIVLATTILTSVLPFASTAIAGVSAEEANRLKTELTPLGAERAGNKDGSIPAWQGGFTKAPTGYVTGEPRIDPYASDKPLYSVNAKNAAQYADLLSDGTKELLKKYPSFRVDVYPTRRTAAAPQWVYDNTFKNATSASTKDGGNSVEKACGGIPFPIPKTGNEAMWNHVLAWKGQANKMAFRSFVVPADGKPVLATHSIQDNSYPYAHQNACAGFSGDYWNLLQVVVGPAFKAGEQIMLKDPLDQVSKGRQAWQYLVGQRRVRRAPTIAYDTPDSVASGANYFDEAFMFIGSQDRFQWKLVGKKELLIPYNNNSFWLKKPEELMQAGHLNPDALRWERHRVWVVDAELASGKRNVVPKRRYYLDEDTWNAVLYDGWDAQGQFWRTSIGVMTNVFELPGTVLQTFAVHNLLSNSYILANIPNGLEYQYKQVKPYPESYFTPDAMAAGGVR